MYSKRLGRVFGFILALAALASLLCVPAFADGGLYHFTRGKTYNNNFRDVAKSDWFYACVSDCYAYGLVSGKGSASAFKPADSMTRAEVITLACRVNDIFYGGDGVFDQSWGDNWYDVYVDFAWSRGIIDSGTFDEYNVPCTREEAAYILYRSVPESALPVIRDVNYIPGAESGEWCIGWYNEVRRLYRAGIISGNDAYGSFAPYDNVKRCEVIAMVNRIVNPSMREKHTLQYEIVVDGTYTAVNAWEQGNYITFSDSAKTFSLTVNLYEGYGHISGTYTRSGEYLDCTVTYIDYSGFAGEKTKGMCFRITFEDTLVLVTIDEPYGAGSISSIPLYTQFER